MKHFLKLIVDFFRFPFYPKEKSNRFRELLQFLFVDFPAYMWHKPSIWRVLLFPFLLVTVLFNPLPKKPGKKEKRKE